MVTAEFVVTGVVQGVGFRWFTRAQARRLDLKGWVRNRADGSVHAIVQGPEHAVAQLEQLLRQGPPGAVVENVVRSSPSQNENFESFEVAG